MGDTTTAIEESLATEFLRLVDEGWNPQLDEFLSRVPEEHRAGCRARIDELAALNGVNLDAPETEDEQTPLEQLATEISPLEEIEEVEEAPEATSHETPEAVAQLAALEETAARMAGEPEEELDEDSALEALAEQLRGMEAPTFEEEKKVTLQSAAEEFHARADEQAGDEALVAKMEEPPPVENLQSNALEGDPVDYEPAPAEGFRTTADELAGEGVTGEEVAPVERLQTAADMLAAGEAFTGDETLADVSLSSITHHLAAQVDESAGIEALEALEALEEPEAQEYAADESLEALEALEPEEPTGLAVLDGVEEIADDEPVAAPQRMSTDEARAMFDGTDLDDSLPPPPRDEPRYAPLPMPKKKKPEPEPKGSVADIEQELQRHMREAGSWGRKQLIPEEESDRLCVIYRRLLDHEPETGIEEVGHSLLSVLLYVVATIAAVGSVLLVWFGAADLPAAAQVALPAVVCLGLVGAGIWALLKRRDEAGATVFLASGVIATLPAALAAAMALGVFSKPSRFVVQLVEGSSVTNGHLFVACVAALLVAAGGLALVRRAVFAWMAALLAVASYVTFLMTGNLLGLGLDQAALRLLPLLLLAVPALLFESKGRVRWALPFDLIAMIALVGCVDAMAVNGRLFHLVGLDSMLAESRQPFLGFTLSGVLLLGVMVVMERTRSLDLHAGARLLRVVVAAHVLVSLYANALTNGAWRDVAVYMAAAAGLLVLGRMRRRSAFLIAGLAGLALSGLLVLHLGLVNAVGFTLVLTIGGLLATFGTYAYIQKSRQLAQLTES